MLEQQNQTKERVEVCLGPHAYRKKNIPVLESLLTAIKIGCNERTEQLLVPLQRNFTCPRFHLTHMEYLILMIYLFGSIRLTDKPSTNVFSGTEFDCGNAKSVNTIFQYRMIKAERVKSISYLVQNLLQVTWEEQSRIMDKIVTQYGRELGLFYEKNGSLLQDQCIYQVVKKYRYITVPRNKMAEFLSMRESVFFSYISIAYEEMIDYCFKHKYSNVDRWHAYAALSNLEQQKITETQKRKQSQNSLQELVEHELIVFVSFTDVDLSVEEISNLGIGLDSKQLFVYHNSKGLRWEEWNEENIYKVKDLFRIKGFYVPAHRLGKIMQYRGKNRGIGKRSEVMKEKSRRR